MITDHAYDAGPTRPATGEYCLYNCGQPENEHAHTEYAKPSGDMHEPKPYTGELDWPNTGQFPD